MNLLSAENLSFTAGDKVLLMPSTLEFQKAIALDSLESTAPAKALCWAYWQV
jgi:hypothetical protein